LSTKETTSWQTSFLVRYHTGNLYKNHLQQQPSETYNLLRRLQELGVASLEQDIEKNIAQFSHPYKQDVVAHVRTTGNPSSNLVDFCKILKIVIHEGKLIEIKNLWFKSCVLSFIW
jgi:hypothetical protein